MKRHIELPCDFHIHTEFSGDSHAPVSAMSEQAIQKGLSAICITDHLDFDYPYDNPKDYELDGDTYFDTVTRLSEQYADQIQIMIGVETGLEPDKAELLNLFISRHPYDFIIGSSHLIHR